MPAWRLGAGGHPGTCFCWGTKASLPAVAPKSGSHCKVWDSSCLGKSVLERGGEEEEGGLHQSHLPGGRHRKIRRWSPRSGEWVASGRKGKVHQAVNECSAPAGNFPGNLLLTFCTQSPRLQGNKATETVSPSVNTVSPSINMILKCPRNNKGKNLSPSAHRHTPQNSKYVFPKK